MLHVVFTGDGIPGWIGTEPREGSEKMPETIRIAGVETPCTVEVLAGHMRRPADGRWVKRPKPPAPTAEERQAARQAQRQAIRDARRAELRAAIAAEMPELLAQLALGEITREDLAAARQAIRDRFTDREDD